MQESSLLITDGECSFCQNAAKWLAKKYPGNWENRPNQSLDLVQFNLTKTEVEAQVWYLVPSKESYKKYGGAKAVAKLLLEQEKAWIKPFAILAFLPVTNILTSVTYRLIALNRGKLGWIFK